MMTISDPSQGYIFLATGHRKYFEMAISAAMSAKWMDPDKKVCLIHDGVGANASSLPDYASDIFDDLVVFEPEDGFVGVMNKMLIYDLCPYDEAFFVDGDCFVMKKDMDRHWAKFGRHDFTFAGEPVSNGSWYGFDIAKACTDAQVPYLVRGNTGVFFFRKSDTARTVFDTAKTFVREKPAILGVTHQNRAGQYSDEPFLGAAMGATGVTPVSYTAAEGSIMVTTLYARFCKGDLESEISQLKKPSSGLPTDRFWALKYVTHSPSIMHFIGLKPRKLFDKLSRQARARYGVPDYDFFA
ncbi:MAG: hypothetical protein AAFW83_06770 [Pseudomonadota bacterium]